MSRRKQHVPVEGGRHRVSEQHHSRRRGGARRPAGCSTTAPASSSTSTSSSRPATTRRWRTCRRSGCDGPTTGRRRRWSRSAAGIGRMTCQLHPRCSRSVVRLRPRRRLPRAMPRDRRPVRHARAPAAPVMSPTGARSPSPTTSPTSTFSYITLQHCQRDDALALAAEAVRVDAARRARRAELPHVDRRATCCCGRPARSIRGLCRMPGLRAVARSTADRRPASAGRPTGCRRPRSCRRVGAARSTCGHRPVAAATAVRHRRHHRVDLRRRQPQPLVARRHAPSDARR